MAIISMIIGGFGGFLGFLAALLFFGTSLAQALLLYTIIGAVLTLCLIAAGLLRRRDNPALRPATGKRLAH